MTTTRWAAVVDGLVAAMRARSGFQAPSSIGSDVIVFDGPEVDNRPEDVDAYLVIGVPGDGPQSGDRSGQVDHAFGPMASTRPRDETGLVECRAVAQLGDVDTSGARTAALALVAAVEDQLRTTPTLGLDPAWMRWAAVTRHELRQYLSGGSVCEIDFTVSFLTRLT